MICGLYLRENERSLNSQELLNLSLKYQIISKETSLFLEVEQNSSISELEKRIIPVNYKTYNNNNLISYGLNKPIMCNSNFSGVKFPEKAPMKMINEASRGMGGMFSISRPNTGTLKNGKNINFNINNNNSNNKCVPNKDKCKTVSKCMEKKENSSLNSMAKKGKEMLEKK